MSGFLGCCFSGHKGKVSQQRRFCTVVLLSERLPLNYSCPAVRHEQESRDPRRRFDVCSPWPFLFVFGGSQVTAWIILKRAQLLLLCLKTSKTFFFFVIKEYQPYISLSYCRPPDVSILFTKRCSPDKKHFLNLRREIKVSVWKDYFTLCRGRRAANGSFSL